LGTMMIITTQMKEQKRRRLTKPSQSKLNYTFKRIQHFILSLNCDL
jgi:hypothetical protein